MIDWSRCEIPFQHAPLPAGMLMAMEPDGSVEWVSPKRLECRSSHETSIMVRSSGGDGHGFATSLLMDGNLAKFLQGHNVFGSRDLKKLTLLAFQKVFEFYFDHLDGWCNYELTCARIAKGDFLVKMLDINNLYDIGNDHSVESFLHAIEMKARSRTGRALRDKGSVYVQKHSRRWAIKFYNKLREILARGKSHKLPEHLQGIGLEDYVRGKVRAELRLMSLELKDLGLTHGYHFTEQAIAHLFDNYMGRIEMSAQFQLIDEEMLKLPRSVQSTYQLWKQGFCLKDMLPHNTFYRHRRLLLDLGIDITLMRDDRVESNVVPIIRVLEATPVSVPYWAYEKGLIAC